MAGYEYHLVDVFTRTPFHGNALAVFVDQPALSTPQMQRIAAELNLSETVFVSTEPDATGALPIRIFTPGFELPFAGHPTVGTAVLLGSLGFAPDGVVVLAEGVGPVHVEVAGANATFTTATLPERLSVLDREEAAAALGIEEVDLHPDLECATWSCGVPFAVTPIRVPSVLGRCHPDRSVTHQLFPLAPVGGALGARWQARMFAPAFGIAEDPATGSAAAAIAGFFAQIPALDDINAFEIAQGVEMGRPSRIDLFVERDTSGALQTVRVGGEAVIVGSGSFTAPPS